MLIDSLIRKPRIAVVIPCYRVRGQILGVLAQIGPEVAQIIVVDDKCPDGSGKFVADNITDPRVNILFHSENKGVGGAVMTGYRYGLKHGADVMVKVDGDGQMDPGLITTIAQPVLEGRADYAKGNRFHSVFDVRQMPKMRLFGNACLSFMTKLSSGYWSLFDPTNGYTAIHSEALQRLELGNISERYFFESDMLINLGNVRAVVSDVPMRAHYGDEVSNLHIRKIIGTFLFKNIRELSKRLLYNYFMRDFSVGSVQLVMGLMMLCFGSIFGAVNWAHSLSTGDTATTGTVMVATLPIILGFQLLLNFLSFDIANEPKQPLQPNTQFRAWLAGGTATRLDANIAIDNNRARHEPR